MKYVYVIRCGAAIAAICEHEETAKDEIRRMGGKGFKIEKWIFNTK
jgi:hypothetical protein